MATPIKVVITGASGRMGGRLVSLTQVSDVLELAGGTEAPGHPSFGKDLGEIAGCPSTGIQLTENFSSLLSNADVTIDFTSPVATLSHLEQSTKQGRAMVIGTTGFSTEQLQAIRRHAERIPCVMAPNMSVGINVLLQVIGKVAQALGDEYDLEIVEAHHRLKKDAPSGTALILAEALASAKNWDLQETGMYARHGLIGERKAREIGIQTVRAGDIAGDHTILFGGLGERIEITHRAHNRDPFVRGALRAAEWVVSQPPGLYSMAQVLGL
jgi:4-hydroxy-tetrahydrodipicolinate reductase